MTYVEDQSLAPVTREVAVARAAVAGEQIVPRSRCIDWLLDCLNAARRPTVRAIIVDELTALSPARNLRTADFEHSLDQIQLALQVDEVFDQFVLEADASDD
ncbi:MAG: hypothetical protein AAFN30_01980 [Actinomycetota bacterium]